MGAETIGVGIIGCGRIFDLHMRGYQGRDDAAVLAVADISEERRGEQAARYGIPRQYGDYRELLEDDSIDLVEILTPTICTARWPWPRRRRASTYPCRSRRR